LRKRSRAADLAHDLLGDLGLGAGQLQRLEVGQASASVACSTS
jgi:hypothetical protein